MNSFQILDKDGNAIPINTLDKEAADFWNKELDPKYYADPSKKDTDRWLGANWFDTIGWYIANQGNYTTGWANVVSSLVAEPLGQCLFKKQEDNTVKVAKFVDCKDGELHLESCVEKSLFLSLCFFQPFIDLINHWAGKGYTPKQIIE